MSGACELSERGRESEHSAEALLQRVQLPTIIRSVECINLQSGQTELTFLLKKRHGHWRRRDRGR